ncbi:cholesterol 7-desaturase-like [Centruroides sculpturatus]|uniref:cholesterol 7-desaturase-like n=1 Tax=Centruroides sculpturatus TaxID=218467 RepID=UPI000C6D6677|nr:cholesterol 7-desaturase-like [Centruroides sculpturatus]
MTDIGYDDGRTNAKKLLRKRMQLLKETNRLRRANEFPPVYPNGWIPLLESRDLPVGKCKPVTALGQQFVIFRGKTGKCFVLDAFCPHLGAHLGTDGKVHEDCIECPFHGWRFAGQDGSCVKIPYAEKIPEVAKIKSWETLEQNGFIYLWHHAEGQPALWKPSVIPEVQNRLMRYRGRSEHIVNCHIQEVAENGADFIHLNYLHKFNVTSSTIPHPENWWRFLQFTTKITCLPVSEKTYYCIKFKGNTTLKLFGISILNISFEIQEIEQDIRIWNYKMYLKNPIYMSEDKTIAKFRKWYSQFYSENSPRFEEQGLNW